MPVITRSQSKRNAQKHSLVDDSYVLAVNILCDDDADADFRDDDDILLIEQKINTQYQNTQIFKQIIREKLSLMNKLQHGGYPLSDRFRLAAELFYIIQDWFPIILEQAIYYGSWYKFLKTVQSKAYQFLDEIESYLEREQKYTIQELQAVKILVYELNATNKLIDNFCGRRRL